MVCPAAQDALLSASVVELDDFHNVTSIPSSCWSDPNRLSELKGITVQWLFELIVLWIVHVASYFISDLICIAGMYSRLGVGTIQFGATVRWHYQMSSMRA